MNTFDNETVKQAIQVFYTQSEGCQQAHEYLKSFTKSSEAWIISFELILSEEKRVRLFGLTTLKSKLQLDFHKLSEENRQHLFNKCFEMSSNLINSDNSTIQLLGNCISLLYIQWQSWNNILEVLIPRLFNSNSIDLFLVVLSGVSTNLYSRDLAIIYENQQNKIEEITAESEQVYQQLMQIMSMPNLSNETICKLYECLRLWIHLKSISSQTILSSPFLPNLFQLITNIEYTDVVTDCLNEILEVYTMECDDPSFIAVLIPHILALKNNLDAYLVSDEELAGKLLKSFSIVSENILSSEDAFSNNVSLEIYAYLANIFNSYNREICTYLIDFFYTFFETLKKDYLPVSDSYNQHINQIVQSIFTGALKNCQYPEDVESFNKDDLNEFSEYRFSIIDLFYDIKDYYDVLNYFEIVSNFLMNSLSGVKNGTTSIYNLDAIVASLYPIGTDTYVSNSEPISQLFNSIQSLPANNLFYNTLLGIIRKMCTSWKPNSESLQIGCVFATNCLSNNDISMNASKTLRQIFQVAYTKLENTPALQYILTYLTNNLFSLSYESRARIMEGITECASNCTTGDALEFTKSLTTYCCQQLRALYDGQCVNEKEYIDIFHLLTICCDSCKGNPTYCNNVFSQNSSYYYNIINRFNSNEDVIDKFCTYIKHLMRIDAQMFMPSLPQFLSFLKYEFDTNMNGSSLYVLGAVYAQYHNSPCEQSIRELVVYALDLAIKKSKDYNIYVYEQDFIDDLISFVKRILEVNYDIIFDDFQRLLDITDCAIHGCLIQNRLVYENVASFISILASEITINNEKIKAEMEEMIKQKSYPLMKTLMNGMLGELPQSLLESHENIMISMWSIMSYWPSTYKEVFPIIIREISNEVFNETEKNEIITNLNADNNMPLYAYIVLLEKYIKTGRQRQRVIDNEIN